MTRTEIKRAAQDELMDGIRTSFTMACESGTSEAVLKEMSNQMARIEKMFGYIQFSFNRGI